MDNQHFRAEMRRIYANHGRTPSDTVLFAVWKRVEPFADSFMTWAADKLSDYEKLPGNIGLELVRNLHPQWRSKSGQQKIVIQCCPECDRQTPGFFTAWRKHGQRVLVRCRCNNDAEFDPMKPMTRNMAANLVYDEFGNKLIVAPQGTSFLEFEREHFPVGGSCGGNIGPLAVKLARDPVGPEKPRESHVALMEEYGDVIPF